MKVLVANLTAFVMWVLIAFFVYVLVRGWMQLGQEGFALPEVEKDQNGNDQILSGGERTALFEDIVRTANTNQDVLKSIAPDLELAEFQVQKSDDATTDTRSFLATNVILFVETSLKPQEVAMNRRVPQYAGNSDVQDLAEFLRAIGPEGIVGSESRDRMETQLLKFIKKIVDSHRRSLHNVQKDIQKEIENNQLAVSA